MFNHDGNDCHAPPETGRAGAPRGAGRGAGRAARRRCRTRRRSPGHRLRRQPGHRLRPAGQGATYAKGLGVHATSDIGYYLAGRCSTLVVDVGVDDESGSNGSVAFQVYRDAVKVADSGVVRGTGGAVRLTDDLTGGQELRLVVTHGGDSVDYDHADWGGPVLTCS